MSEDNKTRIREFIDKVLQRARSTQPATIFTTMWWKKCRFPSKVPGFRGSRKRLPEFDMPFPIRNGASRNKLRKETKSSPALPGQARIRENSWYSRHRPSRAGLGNGHRSV
jgi:hypothetical protein